jgi:predicted dithiol-disulfide oxidoreductase (DUF899 family)
MTARGLEPAMAYYFVLDRAPMGRQEEDESEHWVRHLVSNQRPLACEAKR